MNAERGVCHDRQMLPAPAAVRATSKSGLVAVPTAPEHIGKEPRRLEADPGVIQHALAMGRYQSPLRYPGAKTGLADAIGQLVTAAQQSRQIRKVDLFVEPFAGGASTSLRLLGSGVVDRVLLADADPLVAAFWQVAASQTEDLIDRMYDEHAKYLSKGGVVALSRWDYWRSWVPSGSLSIHDSRFSAAMKCLFLNRTTFSGILHGRAGPIGGRAQTSPYGIACRFNVEALAERLRYVGHLYDTQRIVDVWCKDWATTLADVPEWYAPLVPNRVLAYLDPPYLNKSSMLYQRSFDGSGGYAAGPTRDLNWSDKLVHHRMSEYLRRKMQFRWILSYDSQAELLEDPGLYQASRMTPDRSEKELLGVQEWRISKRLVSLRYTASARAGRGPADELLLTTLPASTVPINESFRSTVME